MPEVQKHGFAFQEWIKTEFFENFQSNYSDKWDIPKEYNHNHKIPQEYWRLPVSIKTAKNKSPIGFGDAIRQYDIDSDFILIVGFWKQIGGDKYFVSVEAKKIKASFWKSLWVPLKRDELLYLDTTIKDTSKHYFDVRKEAQEIKRSFPPTKITLNPKIDSKKQRRLQCSLLFNIFWEDIIQKNAYENLDTSFWGMKVPNPFKSPPRTFND
ncbi:MAG TPA: hypothetical protein PKW18_08390 [Candidatus Sumerlaeota bacterium]|nr:hypothetical protein [Candidatus Sumerlaeota bacterium]HPL74579.1 hypothetical protein [Candidatus Sumerlaeota bacterium]